MGNRFLDSDDQNWLPAFSGFEPMQLSWRRGLLETVTVRSQGTSLEFGRALAMQAVCKGLRTLSISCEPDCRPSVVVQGLIAGGGLPCVRLVHFKGFASAPSERLAIRSLEGFRAAFPSLDQLEVEASPLIGPVG